MKVRAYGCKKVALICVKNKFITNVEDLSLFAHLHPAYKLPHVAERADV